MRKTFRWLILILLLCGIGYLIWHFTRPKPIKVIVRPAERGTVEKTVSNTRAGTIKACRRAKLSPSIGGQILKLPIKKGDEVKAGQLLLELWNEDMLAEERLAESEASAAKAKAKAICLRAEMSQRNAQRFMELNKKGAISEDTADKSVTEAKALHAECAAAEASAVTSQARIRVVRANIARTRLIAPFDGVIAEINGELSEYVTPSPIGIPTPPVVDLIDNACFYITAPIDEVDAPLIRMDMVSRITLDAFGKQQFSGKVRRISDYVLDREKQARTVDIEVEFIRPKDIRQMLAGYSADVEIILEVKSDTLRIPTEAVLDGKRVFVFLPAEKIIRERQVQIGISNWDFTEIISGLSVGESVVKNVDQAGVKDSVKAEIGGESK